MKTAILVSLLSTLLLTHFAYANDIDLDKPIPASAIQLVLSADKFAEKDQVQLAQANYKKAISIAPNYMYAHTKYVRFMEQYLNRRDDVTAEYEALMRKEPKNPIYPMALTAGLERASEADRKKWAAEVVRLAPNWVWSHYARVSVLADFYKPIEDEKTVAEILSEIKQFIAGDGGSWSEPLYIFEYYQKKVSGIDDSILSVWERLNSSPGSSPDDQVHMWNLRLLKEKKSTESVNALKTTLSNIVATSHDLKMLVAAYQAYDSLLSSPDDAAKAKKAVLRVDPTWYPDRGRIIAFGSSNITGIPYSFYSANRQYENFEKMKEVIISSSSGRISDEEEISQLKDLEASLHLSSQLKRLLYRTVFYAAASTRDADALNKYGKLLLTIDPTDAAVLTVIATALVDKASPADALRYATAAEQATAKFQPVVSRPANNGVLDDQWKKTVTDEWQRQRHDKLRSRALDALGYANFRLGNLDKAEAYLNESITLSESDTNLGHLSQTYEKSGKKDLAETYRKRSDDFYRSALKKSLTNEKVKKDFEFKTIDGKTIKLSDLKGKVVLVDLWATWCSGCIASIPHLKKLYEELSGKGFEILFVSTDRESEKSEVLALAREKDIPFPVVFDTGFGAAYNINELPTSFVIDPNGNIRRRHVGFDSTDTPKEIETMFDLLKNEETGPDPVK